jgi:hypothetical protein
MPTRGNVRDFQYGGIELGNLAEPNDQRVALLRVANTEKLPAVVVLVVSDVQDGRAAKDDRLQSNDRTLGRLIEWPRRVRQGG